MTTTPSSPTAGAASPEVLRAAVSVSVVICAYTDQRWNDLAAAIASVRAQSAPASELIVVVDHNPELAVRVRQQYPFARVVENAYAQGLSGARNTGCDQARADIVAFLDDDAVAAPDWLERLTAAYRPNVLGVGGVAEPAWVAMRPRWFPPEFDWVVGCTYLGLPESAAPVRNMIGANMSLRRGVLEHAGGFDASLGRIGRVPAGCEETDLCIRARSLFPDGDIILEPRAQVSHTVTTTRATARYFASRCFAEGQSKAIVARRSGARAGLASERSYAGRTLPRGFVRGVTDALARRDPFGIARAGVIAAGLVITSAGYLVGKVADRVR